MKKKIEKKLGTDDYYEDGRKRLTYSNSNLNVINNFFCNFKNKLFLKRTLVHVIT